MDADKPFGFDLWHEDGLLADEHPGLFVDLGRVPVVFTIRGIAYFSPRFRHVGVDIASITTRDQFESARWRWDQVEYQLLQERIRSRARPGVKADPYNALQAVLDGDSDAFERHIAALEHRKRAGLSLVDSRSSPERG
jgi:hypothetical protein